MVTLLQITAGIKSTLDNIAGLSAYAIEPPSPKFPCLWPFFRQPAADYNRTFDNMIIWHFSLTVAVQASDVAHAQTNLMPYLAPTGDKSIKAMVESIPTLGLAGVYASVLRVDQIGPLQVAGASAWAATLPLDVMVSE